MTDADFRFDLRPSLQPALLALLAFGVGIGAQPAVGWPARLALPLAIVAAGLAIVTRICRRTRAAAYPLVLIALAAAGLARMEASSEAIASRPLVLLIESDAIAPGDPVELTGYVSSPPEAPPGRLRLRIHVDAIGPPGGRMYPLEGEVQVSLAGEGVPVLAAQHIDYGSTIRVVGTLDDDLAFRNPGVETLRESLRRRDLDASLRADPAAVVVTGQRRLCPLLAELAGTKRRWLSFIDASFDVRARGLLDALLLGDDSLLDDETAEVFRRSGTYHILVISGAHIALVAGCLLWPVSRLSRRWSVRATAGLTPVWLYSLLVGLPSPVWRSALAITIALAARAVWRPAPPPNTLALAAMAILAWDPRQLYDAGFQLTFASVAGIVLLAAPILAAAEKAGRWSPKRGSPYPPRLPPMLLATARALFADRRTLKKLSSARPVRIRMASGALVGACQSRGVQTVVRQVVAGLVVALCVQLALLPLTIEHFHRVAPASLVATLAVEAVLGVALVAGLAMLVLAGPAPWAASLLVPIVRAAAELGIEIARISPSSISVGGHEGLASAAPAVLVVSLVASAIAVSRWRPVPRSFAEHLRPPPTAGRRIVATLLIATILGSAALSLYPPEKRDGDGRLHVTMFDVGQGDCALVVFPHGTTMLVDAGGRPRFGEPLGYLDGRALFAERFDIGERFVCRALWSLGVSRLDLIAATHGDADHVGGFDAVLRHFPVGAAILPSGRDQHIEPFRLTVERAGIPIRDLGEGSVLEIDGVRLEVQWPRSGGARGNNASLVMRLVYGSRAIALTGDVEREGERELVRDASARGATLDADILKVAHHGSRSSTTEEFLAAVHPSVAVISAPRLSPYGHPHPEVVERLQRSNILVLQTGRIGAVECINDGCSWTVRPFTTQPPPSSTRQSGTRHIGSEEIP